MSRLSLYLLDVARRYRRRYRTSLLVSWQKCRCFARRLLGDRSTIVYFWTPYPNFGDMLNHDLLNYMGCKHLGPDEIWAYTPAESDGTAIGSVLEYLLCKGKEKTASARPIKIFGSGFVCPAGDEEERPLRPLDIYALRGKLSKARCERIMSRSLDHVVLGDPGLLIKRIFAPIDYNPKYDVGVVYHYIDEDAKPFLDKIKLRAKSYHLIDVHQKTEDFVKEVARCKFILSSGMHPLICADSLGIPNAHMIVSDHVIGGDYKFLDYYSVFPQYEYKPVDMRMPGLVVDDDKIDELTARYNITTEQVDKICDQLERVFPFPRGKSDANTERTRA